MKHANFNTPITIADDPSPSYYPINGSLFFLWFMFPFKNVFIADLAQLPFFALAFLSAFAICRKLSLSKEYSFYAAAFFLITPNIFKHMTLAYVDVMFTSLFLATVNFLMSLKTDFKFRYVLVAAVCFGLFMGIKTSAIIYGVFPFLFFIVILLQNIKKSGPHISLFVCL